MRYFYFVAYSILTDKFQTTIPREVRKALGLRPRQRLSYSVRGDGSVVVTPEPQLDELYGSLKLNRPVATPREEKVRARVAMAQVAAAGAYFGENVAGILNIDWAVIPPG